MIFILVLLCFPQIICLCFKCFLQDGSTSISIRFEGPCTWDNLGLRCLDQKVGMLIRTTWACKFIVSGWLSASQYVHQEGLKNDPKEKPMIYIPGCTGHHNNPGCSATLSAAFCYWKKKDNTRNFNQLNVFWSLVHCL